jgi:hypothetical protein
MSMTETLQRALELTESVQEAIQSGDWVRAGELEQERRATIEAFALAQRAESGDVGEAATSVAAEPALRMLQDLSLRMIGEVHHHRRRILREAATVQTNHAAVEAYEDH